MEKHILELKKLFIPLIGTFNNAPIDGIAEDCAKAAYKYYNPLDEKREAGIAVKPNKTNRNADI